MSTDVMTPDAKGKLARTIRALRAQLLADFAEAVEREYRLSIPAEKAKLTQEMSRKRARLEDWIGERQRAEQDRAGKKKGKKSEKLQESTRSRLIDEVVQEAGYTLLNRLVYLRILEGTGLRSDKLIAKGWSSTAYQDFRELAAALTSVASDETEGYAFLLQLVFDELAVELPGLFGDVGLTTLVPVPPATLRSVVEALEDEELESCWVDDTCLGWVYQYWNDPQREALDDKVKDRGKIEPWEVASKTQMFTDRYMAQWLLQNSLGQIWLAICEKNGWQAEFVASGTLDKLDERRASWRAKREAGEVEADQLMPIEGAEEDWKYWVPQPIPKESAQQSPSSLREIKILDPACGSGHFLVLAVALLVPLYQEEARHRNASWSDAQILSWILESNLHGIDIDARAIQIAAASLLAKARRILSESEQSEPLKIQSLQLVAPNLHLSGLAQDDPSLITLASAIHEDTGIAPDLTKTLISGLVGAEYLGTLLRIDTAITRVVQEHGQRIQESSGQRKLFTDKGEDPGRLKASEEQSVQLVMQHLNTFLGSHTKSDDLGLRLAGQQLATGVVFSQMLREDSYDLVIGNPPYHGVGKLAESKYIEQHYKDSKSDLYTVFMERGIQLCREGGLCAMVTLSNWMFLKSSTKTRAKIQSLDLRALADFGKASFANGSRLISASAFVLRNSKSTDSAVAIRPAKPEEVKADDEQWKRTRAALLCQNERFEFDPKAFSVIPESPLVYWWSAKELQDYADAPKLGDIASVASGINSGDNNRFIRYPWEPSPDQIPGTEVSHETPWQPYVKGGRGAQWFEPMSHLVWWPLRGLPIRLLAEYGSGANIRNADRFFTKGIAFTPTGSSFGGRLHRYPSICDMKGASIYCSAANECLTVLNSKHALRVISSLNPTISFQVGDVRRIPWLPSAHSDAIAHVLDTAFSTRESRRETSVEFKRPGPCPWKAAVEWAQVATNLAPNCDLPTYTEQLEPEPSSDHISFALGVALKRFDDASMGIVDSPKEESSGSNDQAIPGGVLFLNGAVVEPSGDSELDGLSHPTTTLLRKNWTLYGAEISKSLDLSSYLRTKFFPDVHKNMYLNRPVHWPISSKKKTYVAWINIHQINDNTLRILLAEYLHPAFANQEEELDSLRMEMTTTDPKQKRAAEKRYATLAKQNQELQDFIATVTHCAEKGPPPPDGNTPAREVDAPYNPDLDDGVMINSAALWPLLEPQWKDPKKWWKELATAKGRKDYDWSHLAKRYFPTRVDKKCQEDPSLAVAHGCFWKYHPEKAYAWELRLQDEIEPEFTIEEEGSDDYRNSFLETRVEDARTIESDEETRRKKRKPSDRSPEYNTLSAQKS